MADRKLRRTFGIIHDGQILDRLKSAARVSVKPLMLFVWLCVSYLVPRILIPVVTQEAIGDLILKCLASSIVMFVSPFCLYVAFDVLTLGETTPEELAEFKAQENRVKGSVSLTDKTGGELS